MKSSEPGGAISSGRRKGICAGAAVNHQRALKGD